MSSSKNNMRKQFQKEKALPPKVLAGTTQGKTCLVRLKKIAGEIYQDCDIYIGPKIWNSHWQFNESPWVNFFHYATPDRKKNLQLYESYIRSSDQLRSKLYSLKGKRLGCFCENHEFCHGSVLLKLVEELCKRDYKRLNNNDLLCFKGEMCPLSNIWPREFVCNKFTAYNSSEQYRLSLFARRMKDAFLLKEVMKCEPCNLNSLSKAVYKRHGIYYTRDDQIIDMYKSISMKFSQCTEFAEYCSDHISPGTIVLECTTNKFWASGKNLENVKKSDDICSFTGLNLVGWIILCVMAKAKKWGHMCQEAAERNKLTLDSGFMPATKKIFLTNGIRTEVEGESESHVKRKRINAENEHADLIERSCLPNNSTTLIAASTESTPLCEGDELKDDSSTSFPDPTLKLYLTLANEHGLLYLTNIYNSKFCTREKRSAVPLEGLREVVKVLTKYLQPPPPPLASSS